VVRSHDLADKVSRLFRRRAKLAQERFLGRVQKAFTEHGAGLLATPVTPWDVWTSWSRYVVDVLQRGVLFRDTLRRHGNTFVERTREGLPPVLRFAYETVLDARTFERPVNYALVRITPLAGLPRGEARGGPAQGGRDARRRPTGAALREGGARVDRPGGYPEALARIGGLINRDDERIPLARPELRRDLDQDYAEFLPAMPRAEMRRIRGEQDIIVRYEPERALDTLPKRLAGPADRERLLTLITRLLADERMRTRTLTARDLARVDAILAALGAAPRPPAMATPRSP
jgi:hypothetical protein